MRIYLMTVFLFMVSMAADDSLVFMKEFDKQKQIVLAKANGKNQTLVTSGENWHLYPDLSSDGQNVVYMQSTDEYGFAILSTNLQSKSIRKWNKALGTHFHPRYSRNMRYLAFSQSQDYKNQIVIVDLLKAQDEGLWTRSDDNVMQYQGNYEVVKDRASCYFPHLSSDASFLVYHRTKADDGREVVFYDRAQKSKKIIAQGMAPSVSFDDRWIAYTAKQGENWNVWVYDRIKDKHFRVTENTSNDYAPSFRADNSLYFASDRSGSLQIYTVSDWQAKNPKAELFISGEDATFYAPRFSGNSMYKQETFEPFPAPSRSSFGSTVHNGYIYVAGGHQGKEHTYPPESFSNQVHRYNIEKKTWEEVAPRKHKCHGFTLASHGKYVYAFGGFTYSPDYTPQWTSLDVIERYDTEKNVWEIVGRMPRKRSSNVAVKVQNKVYLIGGWDSTPKFEHDYDGKFHREIDIFDLESEMCYEADVLAPLPLRRAFTAVAHDDKIYLIGGLSIGTLQFNFLDKVTEFDIKNGSFKDMPPLPFATFAPAAQVIGDDLFVFGGMFEVGYFFEYEYACSIYKYNFNSRTWKNTGRFLTESKGFSQVVKHDDKLFILGGHSYHYNDNGLFLPDGIPNTFKKKSKDVQTTNERNNPVRTTEVFSIQKQFFTPFVISTICRGNFSIGDKMRVLVIVTLVFLLIACERNAQQQNEKTVTIYTHRHYPSDEALYQQFTKETGIKVVVRKGNANELIKKIEIEGEKTEADILITVDVGRLHLAQEKGVLQGVSSETLNKNVPQHLRHKEGYWYALTKRARVVVYHKDRVNPQDLSTYEDLASDKWKGKIAVRSSSNVYNQSLLASIIVANGKEKAQAWAKSVVNNMERTPTGNDRDQVKEVAAGKADLAIINTYYLGKLLTSDNADEVNAGKAVKIFFPNQNGRGTHVNISGAGVTKHAKNKENAMKLIEFLTGKEAQQTFAQVNYEYPIHPEVKPSDLVASWGEFKEDKVNLAELGVNNKEAVKIFDVAGWK